MRQSGQRGHGVWGKAWSTIMSFDEQSSACVKFAENISCFIAKTGLRLGKRHKSTRGAIARFLRKWGSLPASLPNNTYGNKQRGDGKAIATWPHMNLP